jgi:hypothetical protein
MMDTATRFLQESNLEHAEEISKAPIDLNSGFLHEWWTVFWDFYNARASKPSSSEAMSFLNTMKQVIIFCDISFSKIFICLHKFLMF